MTFYICVLLALVAGISMTVQGAVNAALRVRMGIPMSLIIASVMQLSVAVLFYGLARLFSWGPKLPPLSSVPWPLLLGGGLGVVIVGVAMFIFQRLGASLSMSLMMFSQFAIALIVDHYGWLGMPQTPVSTTRIVGVGLLLGGSYLLKP